MKRLILHSTYIKDKFSDNQLFYLKELKKNCDRLVILCNHTNISTKQLLRINNIWFEVIYMDNHWYDFWMFHRFFQQNTNLIEEYDKILFTNDSVLIIKELDDLFNWLNNNKAEYIWIEDWYWNKRFIKKYEKIMLEWNKEYKPFKDYWHIESWFIQISWRAKDIIRNFIKEWCYWIKEQIIIENEMKWSQIAKENWYTMDSYFKYEELEKEWKVKIDKNWLCLCYWYPILMLREGSWFIKKNLTNYDYRYDLKDVIEYLSTKIYLWKDDKNTKKWQKT